MSTTRQYDRKPERKTEKGHDPMKQSIQPMGSLVAAVLALSALFLCGFLFPIFNWIVPTVFVILAAYWGIASLVKMSRGEAPTRHRGYAIAGLVVAALTAVLGIGMSVALYQERAVGQEDVGGGPADTTEDLDERWVPIDQPPGQ